MTFPPFTYRLPLFEIKEHDTKREMPVILLSDTDVYSIFPKIKDYVTIALEYGATAAALTLFEHPLIGRIPLRQYNSCSIWAGFSAAFTLPKALTIMPSSSIR